MEHEELENMPDLGRLCRDHDGRYLVKPEVRESVSASPGANAALIELLTILANLGIIDDDT